MQSMPTNNIVPFPGSRCRSVSACPQCGSQTDFLRFGRLLWAYCDEHAVRWVAADLGKPHPLPPDHTQLRRNFEFLTSFVELSH